MKALIAAKRTITLFVSTISQLQNTIFQHNRHHQQVCVDEMFSSLVEMFFILWCDSCVWPSRTCLIFHVAAAEMNNPLWPHPLLGLHNGSASVNECQQVPFFFCEGELTNTPFTLYELPCQMLFCQTALLLLSVTQQQNVMEYWWRGSVSTSLC